MSTKDYIHGYDSEEQNRLITQANYWRDKLILRELNFKPGERLLEIGCGAGAVLGIIGEAFPGLKLTGIDREPTQIAYATNHLAKLGLQAELKVADASNLPFADGSFDHIYAMWFLEHLSDPVGILKEALRVLCPGGTITLTETDYRGIIITPDSQDYRYLQYSLAELLTQAQGNPFMGPSLGIMLKRAGFQQVNNQAWVYHYFGRDSKELRDFIEYVDGWLAPTLPQIIEKLGKDRHRLEAGLKDFCNIPNHPFGASTLVLYRGTAVKGSIYETPSKSD